MSADGSPTMMVEPSFILGKLRALLPDTCPPCPDRPRRQLGLLPGVQPSGEEHCVRDSRRIKVLKVIKSG